MVLLGAPGICKDLPGPMHNFWHKEQSKGRREQTFFTHVQDGPLVPAASAMTARTQAIANAPIFIVRIVRMVVCALLEGARP